MTVVVATTNPYKLVEIRRILAGLPCAIDAISDHVEVTAPAETGTTFAENARLKALHYAAVVPHLTVAEDSGLEIDRLDGAPGIHSARLPGTTCQDKFDRIYAQLRARGVRTSPARFVCAVALVKGREVVFEATGTIEGEIAETPSGAGGFGYDPIFFYRPYGCTLAEITAECKEAVSHRGTAFRSLRTFLLKRIPPGLVSTTAG